MSNTANMWQKLKDLDALALDVVRRAGGNSTTALREEFIRRWRRDHPTAGSDDVMLGMRFRECLERLSDRGRIRSQRVLGGEGCWIANGQED